jgi:hypothetical protein
MYKSIILWHRDILFYEQQNILSCSIELRQDAATHYINYMYFIFKLLIYHRLNMYHHETYIIVKIEISVYRSICITLKRFIKFWPEDDFFFPKHTAVKLLQLKLCWQIYLLINYNI